MIHGGAGGASAYGTLTAKLHPAFWITKESTETHDCILRSMATEETDGEKIWI